MVASVPDETSRTLAIDGTAAQSFSANTTSRSVGAPKLVPAAAASRTASSTSGCAWPRIIGPHDPT